MREITIAGSGPAGLTAAINLARAGFQVIVYERHQDAGLRFFGDIQGLENWSREDNILEHLQAMGLEVNFDCQPFSRLSVTNGTRTWEFTCEQPAFYLVKRGMVQGSLDQGLKSQTLQSGVEIRYGESLPVEQADIVATGPRHGHVFAVTTGVAFEAERSDIAYGLVNDELAFKGYSYLLVTKGYGCLCTVLFDRFHELNRCFTETVKLFSRITGLHMHKRRRVGGIGSFALHPRYKQDGRLYVGEAAGLQDILWGFGISGRPEHHHRPRLWRHGSRLFSEAP